MEISIIRNETNENLCQSPIIEEISSNITAVNSHKSNCSKNIDIIANPNESVKMNQASPELITEVTSSNTDLESGETEGSEYRFTEEELTDSKKKRLAIIDSDSENEEQTESGVSEQDNKNENDSIDSEAVVSVANTQEKERKTSIANKKRFSIIDSDSDSDQPTENVADIAQNEEEIYTVVSKGELISETPINEIKKVRIIISYFLHQFIVIFFILEQMVSIM